MSITEATARRRLFAGLGVVSTAVALGGIFAAAALAPWFSLFRNALSDLGAAGTATAPLFNGALMLGGALGAGFVVAVWSETDEPVHVGGTFLLLVAMGFMALVGVFPIPSPVHFVVAIAFFVFLTLGVFVFGAGDFAAGRPVRGGALVAGAVAHVASWFWWLFYGWGGSGVAVPELVGSVALAVWALWVSVDLWPEPLDPERL
ncbi:MAG: DUF998 domain-containing protein [Haloarculaceae archaeon]